IHRAICCRTDLFAVGLWSTPAWPSCRSDLRAAPDVWGEAGAHLRCVLWFDVAAEASLLFQKPHGHHSPSCPDRKRIGCMAGEDCSGDCATKLSDCGMQLHF